MRAKLLFQSSALSLLAGFAWAGSGNAQEAGTSTTKPSVVEEVVVTGSFIGGTPTDAALPVSVISSDQLQRQGNPTIVELMKNLPGSAGVLGDQNQYASSNTVGQGVSTVNLRGLGPSRTLVLMNGQRVVTYPSRNTAVDLFSLPLAAIGRVEVLKDGAAATYGSDAIGGVVNFISRRNFDGLEISSDVRFVRKADDPDYAAQAVFGKTFENGNVLFTVDWTQVGRLRANRRDWNRRSYTENPDSGFSISNNPAEFAPLVGNPATLPPTLVLSTIRDPGCETVGSQPGFFPAGPGVNLAACLTRLAGVTVNLKDAQSRLHFYGETNFDLSEDLKFHADAFYSEVYTDYVTSYFPSGLNSPTAVSSPYPGRYYVPASNPGLALLMQQFPTAFPAGTTGVVYAAGGITFRPLGLGGNPLFDNGPNHAPSVSKAYRVSGGFKGRVFDSIGWDVSASYSTSQTNTKVPDYQVNKAQLALRGYGSLGGDPRCTAAVTNNYTTGAGNNALGCYYLNPFSNSWARNSTDYAQNPGAVNPLFNPAVANNVELLKWMFDDLKVESVTRLFELDVVFNGVVPGFTLPGGEIGWAAGAQFRRNYYRATPSPNFDANTTPCPDTPFTGSKNCAVPTGVYALQAPLFPSNIVQNVYAVFGELSLPITDDLTAHVAARYEDYGKNAGGSTFDPKLDVRWQTPWQPLAIRGSVSTTFRAPPLQFLDPAVTSTQIQLGNAFRPINTAGNTDLKPETATTFSVGVILKAGAFQGTIDYWNYNFKKPFVQEPPLSIYNAMFPGNSNVNCNNPASAALQAKFTFIDGVCGVGTIQSLNVSYVNAGGVKTDGIDAVGDYTFDDVYGGQLNVGGSVTWTNKYSVADVVSNGALIARAFEALAKFNYGTGYYPIPRWKASAFAEWRSGRHNLRIDQIYIDGYTDQRTTPFSGNLFIGNVPTFAQATVVPRPLAGKRIKAWFSTDVTYRVELPWDIMATANVTNLFDKDPPFARMELNYDATTASPLGRTYKIGLKKTF